MTFSKKQVKIILISVLTLIVLLSLVFGLRGTKEHKQGAVVANGEECAAIGGATFKRGGSAADAAIATLFCESVTCPQSMGLSGGFLMLIYTRETKSMQFVNARETAPSAATKDMYVNNPKASQTGGLSIAVPGELKGYWEVHQKFGKLPWKELIKPTIELCREGHIVTPYLRRIFKSQEAKIQAEPTLSEIYIDPKTNSTWHEGDKIKRLKLAETLEVIAEEGVDALYSKNGSILPKLLEDIRNFGGILTEDDFLNYQVRWEDAPFSMLKTDNNAHVYSSPLPGSGPLIQFTLNVINSYENFDNSPLSWHRLIETLKYAYALRTKLGDPYFVDGIDKVLKNLSSTEYASYIRKQIDDRQTFNSFSHYGADFSSKEDHGTAHVSILAPNGDAIAVTSTINYILGAMIRSPQTGIILNDEMDDFSTPGQTNAYGLSPSPANYIVPHKRPLSSMAPTIVLNEAGDVEMVCGAAGGAKITGAIVFVVLRYFYFHESLEEAIKAKRIYHLLAPMVVQHERGFDRAILDALVNYGHVLSENPPEFGFTALTAVAKRDGKVSAAVDSRRGGSVSII